MGDLSTIRSSPRGAGDLFPQAPVAPPEGDEHQDDAANDKLFHDRPSLGELVGCRIAQPIAGRIRIQAVASR